MKGFLKDMINAVFLILVLPLGLPIRLAAIVDRRDLWFQFGSHVVSLIPGLPGDYVRRAYYRWVLDSKSVSVGFGTILAQRDTTIGDRTYIGSHCNLGSCDIGEDVLIGSHVIVASPKMHFFDRVDVPINQQGGEISKIAVGEGAWLCNGAIILADIEDNVVVAAGAVVVSRCKSGGVYGGNPAKLIRMRVEAADKGE